MIETIQGPNKENQKELIEEKVVDNIRDIMVLMKDNDDQLKKKNIKIDDEQLIEFNTSIMIFLTSLLEGNYDINLTMNIFQSCEFNILIDRLKKIFINFIQKELKLEYDENNHESLLKKIKNKYNTNHYTKGKILKEGFNITILMLRIIESIEEAKTIVQNFADSLEKLAFEFFKKNIGNVEVELDEDLYMI